MLRGRLGDGIYAKKSEIMEPHQAPERQRAILVLYVVLNGREPLPFLRTVDKLLVDLVR